MNKQLTATLISVALCYPGSLFCQETPPPKLLLAKKYQSNQDITEFLVSEKLDGIRAFWNGESLVTRSGNKIHAPTWFTEHFPKQKLDGELWLGRGQFEQTLSIVSRETPDEKAWRKISYQVFDLPNSAEQFSHRFEHLKKLIDQASSPYLQLVEQRKVSDRKELDELLVQITQTGGEGLMLHRSDSFYLAGRSADLQKLKPFDDAEARVIGHVPGKGKYQNQLGALLVEDKQGNRFKIGSGFSDAQRRSPPALGSLVTFRYRGLTERGLPRFATFVRVRPEF